MKVYISIIVPCYKARNKVGKFIDQIFNIIESFSELCLIKVFLVDDCCPDKSFLEVIKRSNLEILHNKINGGVGSATMLGFKRALNEGSDFFIKMDADGQHDAKYLLDLIPYLLQVSKYEMILIKGSRFSMPTYNLNSPLIRRVGSYFLEPLARISLSYKGLTDIANGFISFNRLTLKYLISPKFNQFIDDGYLFESSILKSCSNLNVDIHEFYMETYYGEDWQSSMNTTKMIIPILRFWIQSIFKRIFNNYFLKLNLGSMLLLASISNFTIATFFFFFNILPNILKAEFASAGNAIAFVGSLLLSILLFCFFVLYDLSTRKKIKKIYFMQKI